MHLLKGNKGEKVKFGKGSTSSPGPFPPAAILKMEREGPDDEVEYSPAWNQNLPFFLPY